MTEHGITVTRALGENSVLIVLGGEIDMANAELVERQLEDAIPNHLTAVTLDLADVTYIDSLGMRVLFNLVGQLRTVGIRLGVIAPVGTPSRRLIEIAGLASVVDIDGDRA